jgi:hypothetical protein
MNKEIQRIFFSNEPQMILISYDKNHQAIFQLLDCDGYRIGKLLFNDVLILAVTTQWQSYEKIDIFSLKEFQHKNSEMFQKVPEDYQIVFFTPLCEKDSLFIGLPRIDQESKGYIVCKSLIFEEEINLGRG